MSSVTLFVLQITGVSDVFVTKLANMAHRLCRRNDSVIIHSFIPSNRRNSIFRHTRGSIVVVIFHTFSFLGNRIKISYYIFSTGEIVFL